MRYCHHCSAAWESEKKIPGVKECCEQCCAYLHCCKNCRFHDPYAPNQCRIPNTESVADRSGANFCDSFEFSEKNGNKGKRPQAQVQDAFAKLFGEDTSEESGKPTSLDDLFGSSK